VGTTRALVIAAAFVAVALAALIPVVADVTNPRTGRREIALIARDMAFYLEGSNVPNPTIVVKASEKVRVTVRNLEPGITHAFSIGSLAASIGRIEPESTESVQFTAPVKLGQYEYVCPPHAQMMKGVFLVTE
jgi:plastocyanin